MSATPFNEEHSFDHDVIITDPYYVIVEDEWADFIENGKLSNPAFPSLMCTDTGYGDWIQILTDEDEAKELGRFAADSGLVAIFDEQEILTYWTATMDEETTVADLIAKGLAAKVSKAHGGTGNTIHAVFKKVEYPDLENYFEAQVVVNDGIHEYHSCWPFDDEDDNEKAEVRS
ncbi:hypothetical protein OZX67_09420 [Bifidobacterium sp. ESL0728]|uniref:hypothetical protein n=1 Tax=Bifidobacterium sp. ESL0728 TaxID=2983220 RepID=UPI0023F70630|nr:hypothetical protein [Bifidobacterium sp. ESL0728]WEV58986.1 hypothetical protein OZX67_09420 [Bifidobacterium sp. ESL0728]